MGEWIYSRYSYSVKRKHRLFINVILEDKESVNEEYGHDFLNVYCVIERDAVTKKFDMDYNPIMFNNEIPVGLSEEQKALIEAKCIEIYSSYFDK